MTPVAFRLLRGYLRRSAWLYAFVGVVQFLLTDFYWLKGFQRVSVPAALLGLWGVAAAINAYNLVWRSLPLNDRDAGIFRWWAIAGVPGLWMTLCDCIAWEWQLTSPGLPAPAVAPLVRSIVLGWAAVGFVAAIPSFRRISRGAVPARIVAAIVVAYVLWLLYGVPTHLASPVGSTAFTAAGLGLLAFSVVEAARGKLWHWPDLANRSRSRDGRRLQGPLGQSFGASAIVLPLLKQTLLLGLAATGGLLALYRLFPGAGAWLFWSYFIAISTAGFLLTYQLRSAIQILRVLPYSAKQLALRLQFFGALPGIVTLAFALLINISVLHVLQPGLFAVFAMIVIASQALPIPEPPAQRVSVKFFKWSSLFPRLWVPFYLGLIAVNIGSYWTRWWWFQWPMTAAGGVLCIVGYFTLVRQLRSGIRPASNEGLFSAR